MPRFLKRFVAVLLIPLMVNVGGGMSDWGFGISDVGFQSPFSHPPPPILFTDQALIPPLEVDPLQPIAGSRSLKASIQIRLNEQRPKPALTPVHVPARIQAEADDLARRHFALIREAGAHLAAFEKTGVQEELMGFGAVMELAWQAALATQRVVNFNGLNYAAGIEADYFKLAVGGSYTRHELEALSWTRERLVRMMFPSWLPDAAKRRTEWLAKMAGYPRPQGLRTFTRFIQDVKFGKLVTQTTHYRGDDFTEPNKFPQIMPRLIGEAIFWMMGYAGIPVVRAGIPRATFVEAAGHELVHFMVDGMPQNWNAPPVRHATAGPEDWFTSALGSILATQWVEDHPGHAPVYEEGDFQHDALFKKIAEDAPDGPPALRAQHLREALEGSFEAELLLTDELEVNDRSTGPLEYRNYYRTGEALGGLALAMARRALKARGGEAVYELAGALAANMRNGRPEQSLEEAIALMDEALAAYERFTSGDATRQYSSMRFTGRPTNYSRIADETILYDFWPRIADWLRLMLRESKKHGYITDSKITILQNVLKVLETIPPQKLMRFTSFPSQHGSQLMRFTRDAKGRPHIEANKEAFSALVRFFSVERRYGVFFVLLPLVHELIHFLMGDTREQMWVEAFVLEMEAAVMRLWWNHPEQQQTKSPQRYDFLRRTMIKYFDERWVDDYLGLMRAFNPLGSPFDLMHVEPSLREGLYRLLNRFLEKYYKKHFPDAGRSLVDETVEPMWQIATELLEDPGQLKKALVPSTLFRGGSWFSSMRAAAAQPAPEREDQAAALAAARRHIELLGQAGAHLADYVEHGSDRALEEFRSVMDQARAEAEQVAARSDAYASAARDALPGIFYFRTAAGGELSRESKEDIAQAKDLIIRMKFPDWLPDARRRRMKWRRMLQGQPKALNLKSWTDYNIIFARQYRPDYSAEEVTELRTEFADWTVLNMDVYAITWWPDWPTVSASLDPARLRNRGSHELAHLLLDSLLPEYDVPEVDDDGVGTADWVTTAIDVLISDWFDQGARWSHDELDVKAFQTMAWGSPSGTASRRARRIQQLLSELKEAALERPPDPDSKDISVEAHEYYWTGEALGGLALAMAHKALGKQRSESVYELAGYLIWTAAYGGPSQSLQDFIEAMDKGLGIYLSRQASSEEPPSAEKRLLPFYEDILDMPGNGYGRGASQKVLTRMIEGWSYHHVSAEALFAFQRGLSAQKNGLYHFVYQETPQSEAWELTTGMWPVGAPREMRLRLDPEQAYRFILSPESSLRFAGEAERFFVEFKSDGTLQLWGDPDRREISYLIEDLFTSSLDDFKWDVLEFSTGKMFNAIRARRGFEVIIGPARAKEVTLPATQTSNGWPRVVFARSFYEASRAARKLLFYKALLNLMFDEIEQLSLPRWLQGAAKNYGLDGLLHTLKTMGPGGALMRLSIENALKDASAVLKISYHAKDETFTDLMVFNTFTFPGGMTLNDRIALQFLGDLDQADPRFRFRSDGTEHRYLPFPESPAAPDMAGVVRQRLADEIVIAKRDNKQYGFPNQLRALREALGLNTEDLARELTQVNPGDPVHDTDIRLWELGVRFPTIEKAQRLHYFFGERLAIQSLNLTTRAFALAIENPYETERDRTERAVMNKYLMGGAVVLLRSRENLGLKADEMVSKTWEQLQSALIRRPDTAYNGHALLSTFLSNILRNEIGMWYRNTGRIKRREISLSDDANTVWHPPQVRASGPSPWESFERETKLDQDRDMLMRRLPRTGRANFLTALFRLQGLSNNETRRLLSDIEGIPVSLVAVKARYHHFMTRFSSPDSRANPDTFEVAYPDRLLMHLQHSEDALTRTLWASSFGRRLEHRLRALQADKARTMPPTVQSAAPAQLARYQMTLHGLEQDAIQFRDALIRDQTDKPAMLISTKIDTLARQVSPDAPYPREIFDFVTMFHLHPRISDFPSLWLERIRQVADQVAQRLKKQAPGYIPVALRKSRVQRAYLLEQVARLPRDKNSAFSGKLPLMAQRAVMREGYRLSIEKFGFTGEFEDTTKGSIASIFVPALGLTVQSLFRFYQKNSSNRGLKVAEILQRMNFALTPESLHRQLQEIQTGFASPRRDHAVLQRLDAAPDVETARRELAGAFQVLDEDPYTPSPESQAWRKGLEAYSALLDSLQWTPRATGFAAAALIKQGPGDTRIVPPSVRSPLMEGLLDHALRRAARDILKDFFIKWRSFSDTAPPQADLDLILALFTTEDVPEALRPAVRTLQDAVLSADSSDGAEYLDRVPEAVRELLAHSRQVENASDKENSFSIGTFLSLLTVITTPQDVVSILVAVIGLVVFLHPFFLPHGKKSEHRYLPFPESPASRALTQAA